MDPRGREIKQKAEPIIDAFNAFKSRNGVAPNSIDELVPSYLPKLPDIPISIEKHPPTGHIVLVIRYTPSWPAVGQVICSVDTSTRQWACHGHV